MGREQQNHNKSSVVWFFRTLRQQWRSHVSEVMKLRFGENWLAGFVAAMVCVVESGQHRPLAANNLVATGLDLTRRACWAA